MATEKSAAPEVAPSFGRASHVSPTRTAMVSAALAAHDPTLTAAYADLVEPRPFPASVAPYTVDRVPDGPQSDPWQVPAGYQDRDGNNAQVLSLRYDGIAAYNFALRYLLTKDESFAEAGARQLAPWSKVSGWVNAKGDATRLNWSFQFPTLLGAATMLRGSASYSDDLDAALKDCATRSLEVPGSIAFTNANNQGDWGVVLVMAIGAFAGDKTVFDSAVQRWRAVMEESIDANGDLHAEIHRSAGKQGDGKSGLHYCLLALSAKIRAAELARANGVWVYDDVSPSGHTLKALWDRLMPWLHDPTSYPYNTSGEPSTGMELTGINIGALEILQRLWPRDDAQAVLDAARPCDDRYGSAYLSLTYPGLPLQG